MSWYASESGTPQDELVRERESDEMIEGEIPGDGDDGGHRIIDIDRPDKIPRLSFKPEITREAVLVHREETPEQRGGTAPRASQAEAPA